MRLPSTFFLINHFKIKTSDLPILEYLRQAIVLPKLLTMSELDKLLKMQMNRFLIAARTNQTFHNQNQNIKVRNRIHERSPLNPKIDLNSIFIMKTQPMTKSKEEG